MKIVKTHSPFLLFLLTALGSSILLLGLLFYDQTITFWPNVWGYLNDGDQKIPILLGMVSFPYLTFYISVLLSYLIFEFYGFKPSLYSHLSQFFTVTFVFSLFEALRWSFENENFLAFTPTVINTFVFDRFEILFYLASGTIGGTILLILAKFIRVITKDYFMFFRFPIAATIGFGSFLFLHTFLQQGRDLSNWFEVWLNFSTPASQFLVGIIAGIIPLYVLRLFLGVIRGWSFKNKPKPSKETPKQQDSEDELLTPPPEDNDSDEVTQTEVVTVS